MCTGNHFTGHISSCFHSDLNGEYYTELDDNDEDGLGIIWYSKTVVITKIRNTVHTAGIDSFSMYRHLTQLSDGIPKQTQRQDFKAFRLIA